MPDPIDADGHYVQDGWYYNKDGKRLFPVDPNDPKYQNTGYGTGDTVTADNKDLPHIDVGGALDDLGTSMGSNPLQIDPNAPGGRLDTSQSDEERARLQGLVGQLQGQATTGSGAWENALRQGTQQSQAAGMALGQSQTGVGYQSQLRNIGNSQGAASQRGAGQAELLRNKSQIDSQGRLSGVLGGMGQTDAAQAAQEGAVQQGIRAANLEAIQNAHKNYNDTADAIKSATQFISDGGEVEGKAKVFGDDERNDTVKAMLSPGEIVIPRSHAGSPESAADFVRALQASKGGGSGRTKHFAEGGSTGVAENTLSDKIGGGDRLLGALLPHIGSQAAYEKMGGGPQVASIQNGGLLDTVAYDTNRGMQLANDDLIGARAAGLGPSAVPQMMQNTTDTSIANAMQAGKRGGSGSNVMGAVIANQEAAGRAGGARADEQGAAQSSLAHALQNQRAQDLAMAQAKQQAGYKNTLMNLGMTIDQQNALKGAVAGAGTAAAGYASLGGSKGSGLDSVEKSSNYDESSKAAEDAFNSDDSGSSDDSGGQDWWEGGEIPDEDEKKKSKDFVAALQARPKNIARARPPNI